MTDVATAGAGQASGTGKPSPECVRSVQFSCQFVQRREDEFVDRFHRCVLDDVLWIQDIDPGGRRALCDGFARSVLWAGLAQDSDELIESALRQVGASHARHGAPEGWYRDFGKALLRALRRLHHGDWGPKLSSDWVSYYMWLSEFIQLGADDARSGGPDGGTAVAGRPGADPRAVGEDAVENLGEVLAVLRRRHFPGDERSLATICTRVALRTGVDLRDPRPDQYADPVAVANVLSILLVLGYPLQAFSIEDAAEADDDADDADGTGEADGPHGPDGRGSADRQSAGWAGTSTRNLRRGLSRLFGRGRRR